MNIFELHPTDLAMDNPNYCDQGLDDEFQVDLKELALGKAVKSEESDEPNLLAWIALIVEQDQSALNLLFKTVSAKVYSLALRITGNAELAEEVTEDTFFQVWRQAPRFDPERGSVMAWIMTIARSRALDARRTVPPFDELTDANREVLADRNSGEGLTDLLAAVEQNILLHQALNHLEDIPRQLISLSFFKGLSHEEIADYTDLPLGTVKSHIRRAVINLRDILSYGQGVASCQ